MSRYFFLPTVLLCVALSAGCADSVLAPDNLVPEDLIPAGLPPAVGNATDSFGFAVTAQDFAFEQVYPLTFTGEASTVGLTVVRYAGGEATLELLDEAGTTLYTRNLAQNVAEGTQTVPGRPARAVVRFEDYTGIVSIGVNGE
ncbi:MAG: hypothetical protein AAGG50_06270 [Bacteroidota bacterium]